MELLAEPPRRPRRVSTDRRLIIRATVLSLALAIVSALPVIVPHHWMTAGTRPAAVALLMRAVAFCLPLVALLLCLKIDLGLAMRGKIALLIAFGALSWALTDLHYTTVELGHYFPSDSYGDNRDWQLMMHRAVLRLDPGWLPHSYRFLPDGVAEILTWLTGSFEPARAIYRLTFTFLLLLSIYYWSRLYTGHGAAIAVVMVYAIVYPASIRYYAGQLTDPMSHLAFVVAYIFLELEVFPFVAVAILLGLLAKESVALLVVYFLFFEREQKHHWLKSLGLIAGSAAVLLGVRAYVQHGNFGYGQISGVPIEHVLENLRDLDFWPRQFVFTIGCFLPFVVLDWRNVPRRLKRMLLVVAPGLIGSSLFFSWLREARNYVPATIILALITVRFLARQFDSVRVS